MQGSERSIREAQALNQALAETQERMAALGNQSLTVQNSVAQALGRVRSQLRQLGNTMVPGGQHRFEPVQQAALRHSAGGQRAGVLPHHPVWRQVGGQGLGCGPDGHRPGQDLKGPGKNRQSHPFRCIGNQVGGSGPAGTDEL